MKLRIFAIIALVSGLALVGGLRAVQETPFPHADHQGLFPVCTGCHAGVTTGDAVASYPPPSQCTGCHDGVREDEVVWNGPTTRITNAVFDHERHALSLEEAGDPAVTCESCHSDPAGERMSVDSTEELETCWACHAHERTEHFEPLPEPGDCTVCHVPLAASGFDQGRVLGLTAPAGHDLDDFLLERHALEVTSDPSRCATCHTQARCLSCHVDDGLEPITFIPPAPTTMDLPTWPAHYPVPPSHAEPDFPVAHVPSSTAECSTCHTSDDCASCHLEPLPSSAASLPERSAVHAPGVALEVAAPESHASPFFTSAHPSLAAASPSTCATCHTETFCVACHDGPSEGGYHPPDFVARHPAAAFGQSEECATCHSTAAFCRACHEESGLGSQGRLGAGYHDAEPIFLLRHGQAARQNLESCASCHQQSDCVQCHGTLGAFQVSPHTADFDAQAAWNRNPRTCLACHVGNPIGGAP